MNCRPILPLNRSTRCGDGIRNKPKIRHRDKAKTIEF
jgi:hypothetical protein